MNENDYRITPLSVLSNVSGINATNDNENRKKRRKRKNNDGDNADLIEIEGHAFQDEKVNQHREDDDGHQIDFCA